MTAFNRPYTPREKEEWIKDKHVLVDLWERICDSDLKTSKIYEEIQLAMQVLITGGEL